MRNKLKQIVTKNDLTAQAITNKIIANTVQNVIFDLETDKTKNEIMQETLKYLSLNSSHYNLIENGFEYAVNSGLIKNRSNNKYNISTAQKKQIKKRRDYREIRLQEIIEQHFNDCNASKEDIRNWLIDSLQKFFNSYSTEWISDETRKTNSLLNVKDGIFKLIENHTQSSKKYNLSKSDKRNLPNKFIEFINTNSPNVNAVLAEYGLVAFSSTLLFASSSIDKLILDSIADSTLILDTNILFNLNLESGTYYGYLKPLKNVIDALNIKVVILPCTIQEYQRVLNNQEEGILNTLNNYPNGMALFQSMKENAIIQTALQRQCSLPEHFKLFINQISDISKFSDDVLCPQVQSLDLECMIINEEVEKNKECQKEYGDFFYDFTNHPKREAPLEHDVKLLKIGQQMRENAKVFILTDDTPLHKYTIEYLPKKDGQPLALRINTLINLLALQENQDWDVNPDFEQIFATLLRKDLFPPEKILTLDDLDFMFEHDKAIANLSEEDIINIGKQYNALRLSEDTINSQVFLSREIAKANRGYFVELTQANSELVTSKNEIKRQKQNAETAFNALHNRISAEVVREIDTDIKNYKFWYLIFPFIVALLLFLLFSILWYFDLTQKWVNIVALLLTLLGASIWELIFFIPKHNSLKRNRDLNIQKEIEQRLKRELNYD